MDLGSVWERRFLDRSDTFFDQQIAVFPSLAGHHHGVGGARTIIKGETINALRRIGRRGIAVNGLHVLLTHKRIELIPLHGGHHHEWRRIAVEFKERKDTVEKSRHIKSVGPHDPLVESMSGKMCVGQDDLIAMPHFGKGEEKFRADAGVNSFQHKSGRLFDQHYIHPVPNGDQELLWD